MGRGGRGDHWDGGDIGRQLRRTHIGVGVADLIHGATAVQLDLSLATTNVRHFPTLEESERPTGPGGSVRAPVAYAVARGELELPLPGGEQSADLAGDLEILTRRDHQRPDGRSH